MAQYLIIWCCTRMIKRLVSFQYLNCAFFKFNFVTLFVTERNVLKSEQTAATACKQREDWSTYMHVRFFTSSKTVVCVGNNAEYCYQLLVFITQRCEIVSLSTGQFYGRLRYAFTANRLCWGGVWMTAGSKWNVKSCGEGCSWHKPRFSKFTL